MSFVIISCLFFVRVAAALRKALQATTKLTLAGRLPSERGREAYCTEQQALQASKHDRSTLPLRQREDTAYIVAKTTTSM